MTWREAWRAAAHRDGRFSWSRLAAGAFALSLLFAFLYKTVVGEVTWEYVLLVAVLGVYFLKDNSPLEALVKLRQGSFERWLPGRPPGSKRTTELDDA